MPEYFAAEQWRAARYSSAWLVAYVKALNERRAVCLLRPEYRHQEKLCMPTRAYWHKPIQSDAIKLCNATRAYSVVAVAAGNVRFLAPVNFKAVNNRTG